ncbi:MAG: nicotinate-nucleotide adenylyltransferase [Pirellulales bacterium]|nr:nicotinate-nucleotide adenylyltransferase [Pirellulales bacterium]
MRIGLYGGSFDPVHYGHLLLAEFCREHCRLDRVLFMPAAVSPHKSDRQPTDARARVEMLRLAIGGHAAFDVSEMEIDRGGPSFTVETLTALTQESPDEDWFFLMGGDSLADLPSWREPKRICELATPVIVARHGSPMPDVGALAAFVAASRLSEIEQCLVQMPLIELSSSDIRRRISAGESIRYQTPRAVEKYIETNGLYRE